MVGSQGHFSAHIVTVASLYHRLLLLVAPATSRYGSTRRELEQLTGGTAANVNRSLSQKLLSLTNRQRKLQAAELFLQTVDEATIEHPQFGKIALLAHLDILFEPTLAVDALALLQRASRNQVIVACWNGTLESQYLTYGRPDHHQFKRYSVKDFLALPVE